MLQEEELELSADALMLQDMKSSVGSNMNNPNHQHQASGAWSQCSINQKGKGVVPMGGLRNSKDYSFIQNRVPSPLNNNFLLSADQQSRRHGRQPSEDYMSLPVPCKNLMKKEEEFKTAPSVLKIEDHDPLDSDELLSNDDLNDNNGDVPRNLQRDGGAKANLMVNIERDDLDESHISSLFTNDNNHEIGETNIQYLNFTSGGKSSSYRQSYHHHEDQKTHEIYLLAKDSCHHGDFKTQEQLHRAVNIAASATNLPFAPGINSDFDTNTNLNYSESAYPSQSIGGFNQNLAFNGSGTFSGISNTIQAHLLAGQQANTTNLVNIVARGSTLQPHASGQIGGGPTPSIRDQLLTPFYYDDASSLMNLSASPSSGIGGGPSAYHNSNFNQGTALGGFRTSNLTAKAAIATYDRIISSSKSNRSQAMSAAYQVHGGQQHMGPIHEEVKVEEDQDESLIPNGLKIAKQQSIKTNIIAGQQQPMSKISSGGGSITRKSQNLKQQDEWMPPKKHNPFEMPLQTTRSVNSQKAQPKQVEKKLMEKYSQLIQNKPENLSNLQPSPLTAQQLNFYNVANFPSMILDHTHDQSTTQLLSINPQDISAFNQSMQKDHLLFSRAKQQQALQQLIIDHQMFQLQTKHQPPHPLLTQESMQSEVGVSQQPSNLEDLMCSQEDIEEIKKRLDFNRQPSERLNPNPQAQRQSSNNNNYQTNTSYVFQTQNSLLSINESMRQLDDNSFMHPVNRVNDSRDEQAAPIPFEDIIYQQQKKHRNHQPPQFFERGQPLLTQRERANNHQQFGVPIQEMPSARSLKNQQAQEKGPKHQQQQLPLKNAPFQYQIQQQNVNYNEMHKRQNGANMHAPQFGLVQKNCINIFQGDQSNSSVNTFNTNQDLGQHLLRLHPQSLLNSCGSGYSSCTRYDATTMDEAAPNQPSLYPLHAFLPHSLNPQLQLNLNRVTHSKPSQVSTARTHLTDTIQEEEHYRPLSSRLPHKNQFLSRHLDEPNSVPPSERQGQQQHNRDTHLNSHRQFKKLTTISEKRQDSASRKSSKVKKRKLVIPNEDGHPHNIVITQKRVQSANGRSREGSQGRDQQQKARKGSPEMEPQGLYKTMVIQKDRVISAATHRGIAGSVNPLKIVRRGSQERPTGNSQQDSERQSIGQQQLKLQLKAQNQLLQNPMMIYQSSPTNIENLVQAQQNLISGNQSSVSGQNSFLNCGSHGHLKSDQKSNQQISSSTSHVNTSQKQGLPPQTSSSTKKKQLGPKPVGVGRPSNDSSKPGVPHLIPKSHSKLKGAPLPPHTVSSKKSLQVKGTPSTGKDSSVTRQKAVLVGGGGGLLLRSNSRNGLNRDGSHPKTEVSKDASAIKSARSMTKGNRPQTAAVQTSCESIKQNLGSRKNSARSLKHHQETLNAKNKENIKPFDLGGPILSHRAADQSNTRNQPVLLEENKGKGQNNGISQSYEVFQRIAQQMAILQNAKQLQGANLGAPQFLPKFSDIHQDENQVPKFVADMMLLRNDQVSRNPLQKLISQNQLKSSDNYVLAKRNVPHAHDIEPYTVQTSVDFQRPQQKSVKRDPLKQLGCISNISASHDPSIFHHNGAQVNLFQQPNHSGGCLQMQSSHHQQQMQSPYTSNHNNKGKPQMFSVVASSLVSSKASSSQKNMHSAGQGQGGYKQTTEDRSAVALKSLEMMEKIRAARQVVRQ